VERVRITGLDAILKRLMDQCAAVLAAPVALPVVAASALALVLAGHRPFRAVRLLGRGGKPFSAVVLNASPEAGGIQGVVHALGVRRLPQLVNVLRGEMSLIGPRPIPYEERERFQRWIPNLLTVKPGMTGPWALRPSADSVEEEMRLNLFYIRNFTFWLDVEIALRSAFRLLTRRVHPGRPPIEAEAAAGVGRWQTTPDGGGTRAPAGLGRR
jgi:undecaprenyl-phosphate galactose phosphotransferase/putative colanic acid biosynthesis UDP-glucose lipid carrier transferase